MIKFLITLAVLIAVPASSEFLPAGKPPYANKLEKSVSQMPDFKELVEPLTKSVVNIFVETTAGEVDSEAPQLPFMDNRPGRSLGSGFVVSEDGYIVTNSHVISKADKISVIFAGDKKEYTANIVGSDDKTDVALIKIEAGRKLEPLYLGDSDTLAVGEWVLAIGNQFQLGQTVTAGIVSAKARRMNNRLLGAYDNFIQTDASINPGSSGGPLINISGQVVGINTAIMSPGRANFGGAGFNIGIGFAIPINFAAGIIHQLKDRGSVIRGMLGVIIQPVDENIATALRLNEIRGALVAEILPDSPAASAGFKPRDVIVKYDGVPVEEHSDLPLFVAGSPVGKTVQVEVLRDARPLVLYPQITLLKDKVANTDQAVDDTILAPDVLGLIVEDVSLFIAKSLKLSSTTGVFVDDVKAGSIAEKAEWREVMLY
jgi:serine protease Do